MMRRSIAAVLCLMFCAVIFHTSALADAILSLGSRGDNVTKVQKRLIQYDYLDRSKKSDKLEFYNNNGAYVMSANGNMAFLTRLSYVNNVKEATAQIIENQKVVVN